MHLGQSDQENIAFWVNTLIFFGSAVITVLMWVMLERARLPGSFLARFVCTLFYLFLFVWAVGFGYGFWWNAIAAKSRSSDVLISEIKAVKKIIEKQNPTFLTGIKDALNGQLISANTSLNTEKNNASASTCNIITKGGIGIRSSNRENIAINISNNIKLIDNAIALNAINPPIFIKGRALTRDDEISDILNDIENLSEADGKLRNEKLSDSNKKLAKIVSDVEIYNTNLRAISETLKKLSETISIKEGEPGFICYDPVLAISLGSIARSIDTISNNPLPSKWRPMEGSKSTEVALLKLWGTFGRFFGETITSERMVETDWVALLAAIAVDIGILILTLIRPRLGGQTFMRADQIDENVACSIEQILRRHREASTMLFYDMHFVMGRKQYVSLPNGNWTSPSAITARDLQTVIASIAVRLAGKRKLKPSSRLIHFSIQRLEQLGWAVPRHNDIDETQLSGFDRWFQKLLQSSALPTRPVIYEFGERDRNLVIRLLDDLDYETKRLKRGIWDTDNSTGEKPSRSHPDDERPSVTSIALIDNIYNSMKKHWENEDDAEALELLRFLQMEADHQRRNGFDLHGVDGLLGTPFYPNGLFLVEQVVASDYPLNTIASVEQLAITKRTLNKPIILRAGWVTISAGSQKTRRKSANEKTI